VPYFVYPATLAADAGGEETGIAATEVVAEPQRHGWRRGDERLLFFRNVEDGKEVTPEVYFRAREEEGTGKRKRPTEDEVGGGEEREESEGERDEESEEESVCSVSSVEEEEMEVDTAERGDGRLIMGEGNGQMPSQREGRVPAEVTGEGFEGGVANTRIGHDTSEQVGDRGEEWIKSGVGGGKGNAAMGRGTAAEGSTENVEGHLEGKEGGSSWGGKKAVDAGSGEQWEAGRKEGTSDRPMSEELADRKKEGKGWAMEERSSNGSGERYMLDSYLMSDNDPEPKKKQPFHTRIMTERPCEREAIESSIPGESAALEMDEMAELLKAGELIDVEEGRESAAEEGEEEGIEVMMNDEAAFSFLW